MKINPHSPKLVFIGEPFGGRVCELNRETTAVGRSTKNHLCLQDPSVSANHCEILANASEIIVRDLKSSNGTFVNAVRVNGQTQLKHGQIIRIGNVNARLELALREPGESATDISAIRQHAKITRELREEREKPQTPPQPVKFEPAHPSKDAVSEHTVAMPSTADVQSPSEPAASAMHSPKSGRMKWFVTLLVMVLCVLAWIFMRK